MERIPGYAVMASEAMARALAAQASALWPQEKLLIEAYPLPSAPRILDAGCGTGEATARLAHLFPTARILGVDVIDSSLELARSRCLELAPRLTSGRDNLFALEQPSQTFDLTLCRHVLHCVTRVRPVIAELLRVTRPGGYIHLVAEDLDMIHFERGALDLREFWHSLPRLLGAAMGIDVLGRHVVGMLTDMALEDIKVAYLVADTIRVPRAVLAEMLASWRDSLGQEIARRTPVTWTVIQDRFQKMIEQVRDPRHYVVWLVPVISARVPATAPSASAVSHPAH